MTSRAESPSPSARRLEAFRGERGPDRPLHPAERGLLWILAAHLCFLPWALGTMHAWSQLTSAALALAGFVLALCPRRHETEPGYRTVPWLKLRRCPAFWLGLALVAYVGLQGVNPAWAYASTPRGWWLVRVADIQWLPAGVKAPFARFNAARAALIFASAWLTFCAIWVGLTRRSSVRLLLLVAVANGLALGGFLAAQHLGGEPSAPGPLTLGWPSALTASFIYHNHAGSYLALVTFSAVGLSFWYAADGARTLKKSTPALPLGLAAACLAAAVFFTLSRGATLTLLAGLVLFGIWAVLWFRRQPNRANPAVTTTLAVMLAAFALVAIRYLDLSSVAQRFDAMAAQGRAEEGVWTRVLIHRAARDMGRDYWLRGAGAGAFRYLSPAYVKRYPAIYENGRIYWDHAHSDWLEIPLELGLAGDLLLLAAGAWLVATLARRGAFWHALAWPLLVGCGQTLLHAAFDFPFQCPAILVTWCAFLALALRSAELSRFRPASGPAPAEGGVGVADA